MQVFQVALVVKKLPANAGDRIDRIRSISWEYPLEEGMATHSSVLAQRIPWTEDPGRIQSMGSQESDMSYRLNHHNGSSPRGATVKEPACQRRRCKRCRFEPWVGKILWGRAWQPTLVFLPRESHGHRRMVGYSPWGPKELNMTKVT